MQIARRSVLLFHSIIVALVITGAAVVGAAVTSVGLWLAVPFLLAAGWLAFRKPFRRWQIAQQSLPATSRSWLENHVPLYRQLDGISKARFERDVKFVLAEWSFEGVGEVQVTPELRLSVAAGAALLLHGRPNWELPPRTVLFYPEQFDDAYEGGEYAEFDGMAHAQGPVILAVEAVHAGWRNSGDGSNVVLHELAHLFDFADTFADGIPSLLDPASADAWGQLARREMRRALVGRSLLRRYAATNTAEFFAVAVENFFERPGHLQREHPALFEAMVALFNINPAGVADNNITGTSAS
jgi:MtfA peptidase